MIVVDDILKSVCGKQVRSYNKDWRGHCASRVFNHIATRLQHLLRPKMANFLKWKLPLSLWYSALNSNSVCLVSISDRVPMMTLSLDACIYSTSVEANHLLPVPPTFHLCLQIVHLVSSTTGFLTTMPCKCLM